MTTLPQAKKLKQGAEAITPTSTKFPRLNLALPKELHDRVKEACARDNVSMTRLVVDMLEAKFPAKR